MFVFTKLLIGFPVAFVVWLGRPFNYNKQNYTSYGMGFHDHYVPRILCILLGLLSITIFLFLLYKIPWVFFVMAFIVFVIDLCLIGARFFWVQKKLEQAKSRNELVPEGFWKDSIAPEREY